MSAKREDRPNPIVGVISGSTRALAAQVFSFYIRVPVKLFRPARIDYTQLLKRSLPMDGHEPWSFWKHSQPAMIVRAIREHGWQFVPNKLLPPMVANSAVGFVLYTSYLSALYIQQSSSGLPHPTVKQATVAGAIAGGTQALVATPLDLITLRYENEFTQKSDSLWRYGVDQLKRVGLRAAYGGLTLNMLRECSSFAVFFGTFELFKGPMYRTYATWWYKPSYFHPEGRKKSRVLYPIFVLTGGCFAAAALPVLSYPLSKVRKIHTIRLQAIDSAHRRKGFQAYFNSYSKTFAAVSKQVKATANGSWLRWLYGGSGYYTLVSMPSTSIGLLVFEIMRLRYAPDPLGSSIPDLEEPMN